MPDASEEFDEAVARSWFLNREGRGDEALAIVRDLVASDPGNPRAHFEYAGALDYLGREADAVLPYRRAQELGLSGDDLPRLYVQLGSTLRNVGQLNEAVDFLQEGHNRFPNHAALRAFHALALVSAERCREAVVSLLEMVTANEDAIGLDGYERALRAYTEELRNATASTAEHRQLGDA